jgi:hypothetical protein
MCQLNNVSAGCARVRVQIELARKGRYLYAHEIPGKWVKNLMDRLYQPKYFRNNRDDIEKETDPDPREIMYSTHFPSFFFGAAGSTSPLHSDGATSSVPGA